MKVYTLRYNLLYPGPRSRFTLPSNFNHSPCPQTLPPTVHEGMDMGLGCKGSLGVRDWGFKGLGFRVLGFSARVGRQLVEQANEKRQKA